jgi:hypothetical protein
MSESSVLEFAGGDGNTLPPSFFLNKASALVVIGTSATKASKLAALAAILSGAPVEDTASKSGVAMGELRRIAGIARGDNASKATKALRGINWDALGTNTDAGYDALIAAANVYNAHFVDTSDKGKKGPMTPTDLAIMVSKFIVAAPSNENPRHRDPQVWVDAVSDAIESALETLAESAAAVSE